MPIYCTEDCQKIQYLDEKTTCLYSKSLIHSNEEKDLQAIDIKIISMHSDE